MEDIKAILEDVNLSGQEKMDYLMEHYPKATEICQKIVMEQFGEIILMDIKNINATHI